MRREYPYHDAAAHDALEWVASDMAGTLERVRAAGPGRRPFPYRGSESLPSARHSDSSSPGRHFGSTWTLRIAAQATAAALAWPLIERWLRSSLTYSRRSTMRPNAPRS